MRTLEKIKADLIKLGVTDHLDVSLLLYLAATSRLTDRKFSVLLSGLSSEGKSTLLRIVMDLLPRSEIFEYSFITKAALIRQENLSNRVIVINEHFADAVLASALRQLQSEGRVLYSLVLEGRPETLELLGPTVILEATVDKDELDFQNRNRAFVVPVSTTPEDLARRFDRIKIGFTESGLCANSEKAAIHAWHHNFQSSLTKGLRVAIPYAKDIQFRSPYPHSQRFLTNFLALIGSVALLDQHQRIRHELADGSFFIEASVQDYRDAYEILVGVQAETGTDDLPEDAQALFRGIKGSTRLSTPEPFTRYDVTKLLNRWTMKQVRRLLPILVANDFLHQWRGEHNIALYTLSPLGHALDAERALRNPASTLTTPSDLEAKHFHIAPGCPNTGASTTLDRNSA